MFSAVRTQPGRPTLQWVLLRSVRPSCRTCWETCRSCCAVAASCWLLLSHSDTLCRRLGFQERADILLQGADSRPGETLKYQHPEKLSACGAFRYWSSSMQSVCTFLDIVPKGLHLTTAISEKTLHWWKSDLWLFIKFLSECFCDLNHLNYLCAEMCST